MQNPADTQTDAVTENPAAPALEAAPVVDLSPTAEAEAVPPPAPTPQEVTAIDIAEAKLALEAALLAASEPLTLNELKKLFAGEIPTETLRILLDELRSDWAHHSTELVIVASGYRFRIKPQYQKYLDRLNNEKPPRYSRAVLETLAIIAYRQPVTRGDIEDIRGVTVSPHILKTLEDRGWIDEIGHKDAPGRPALFATTRHFLDDLNLRSLEELPPLHELQATLDMTPAESPRPTTPDLPGVATTDNESITPNNPGQTTTDNEPTAANDSGQTTADNESITPNNPGQTTADNDPTAMNNPGETITDTPDHEAAATSEPPPTEANHD